MASVSPVLSITQDKELKEDVGSGVYFRQYRHILRIWRATGMYLPLNKQHSQTSHWHRWLMWAAVWAWYLIVCLGAASVSAEFFFEGILGGDFGAGLLYTYAKVKCFNLRKIFLD